MGTLGKTWKMPPRSEEYRKKISEHVRRYGQSEEGLKKIKIMAERRKGVSNTWWKPWTEERKRKFRETKRKNAILREHTFYIVNGELLSGKELFGLKRIRGSTIKKEMKKYTPATQEEIEKWLAEHLLETLYTLELEKMKLFKALE